MLTLIRIFLGNHWSEVPGSVQADTRAERRFLFRDLAERNQS